MRPRDAGFENQNSDLIRDVAPPFAYETYVHTKLEVGALIWSPNKSYIRNRPPIKYIPNCYILKTTNHLSAEMVFTQLISSIFVFSQVDKSPKKKTNLWM